MTYLLLTVAAILPALLLVWFFHARDTFPEPPRVLWTTFALGCLSVIPAVLLGVSLEPLLVSRHALTVAAFESFVIAALCEEACKLAVLLGYSFRQVAFDEEMDGIVYGATAALGFAALENIMYVLDGGFGLALLRGALSVPGHATYGAVMGYYVGCARVDRERRWSLVARGLVAAIALHGLYDFPLMLVGAEAVAGQPGPPPEAVDPAVEGLLALVWLVTVIGGWAWTLRLVKRVRRRQVLMARAGGQAGIASAVVAHTPDIVSPDSAATVFAPDVATMPLATSSGLPGVPAAPLTPSAVAPGGWRLVAAWCAVIGGGTVATLAFLFSALAAVSAASGDVPRENVLYLALGVVIIAIVPGLAGVGVFAVGMMHLNRRTREIAAAQRQGQAAGAATAPASDLVTHAPQAPIA